MAFLRDYFYRKFVSTKFWCWEGAEKVSEWPIFWCWEGVKWCLSAQNFGAEKVLKGCRSDQIFWCWEGVKWCLSLRNFGAEKVLKKCLSDQFFVLRRFKMVFVSTKFWCCEGVIWHFSFSTWRAQHQNFPLGGLPDSWCFFMNQVSWPSSQDWY